MDDESKPETPAEFEREKMVVCFVAAGVGAPLHVRMKKLAKAALRAYGLRMIAPPAETKPQKSVVRE